ncbi:MAG: zinc-binding dehydrogenase [Rhodomicrobium sp.]|nr:zinc-binding dehydrogenase [Rhodomicrobium sp.]
MFSHLLRCSARREEGQAIALFAGGIVVMLAAASLDPRGLRRAATVIVAVALPLCALAAWIGPEIKGAQRWFEFGFFSFQPSEILKPALIVVWAWMLGETQRAAKFPGRIVSIALYLLAAAALLKGMSAEFLLHRVLNVREGQTVLVHAAAGGVGQLLCQWARALGATVIGTAGSREKAAIARDAGAVHVIVYTEEDFVRRVMELTGGHGADIVYDAVGRDTFAKSYEALAVCGHLISYGQASGPVPPIDIAAFANKSATVSRPNFGHYTGTPEKVRSITDNLFRALRSGIIRVNTGLTLPLREAAEAHRALESRRTSGSIVLVP